MNLDLLLRRETCIVRDNVVVAHLTWASKIGGGLGEVVGRRPWASLGGPYGAAKAHCCVAVGESRAAA